MPDIHLRQSGFIYSACGPFPKNKEIQKFKETEDLKKNYQQIQIIFNMTWFMEILKICLEKKLLIKVLCNDAFNIAKNPRYDRYQRGLTLMVYKFFDKKTVDGAVKNEIIQSKGLD